MGAQAKQLRVLWRMRRMHNVTAAALYEHGIGAELRVYVEPNDADNVVYTCTERCNVAALEAKARELRSRLVQRGWRDVELR